MGRKNVPQPMPENFLAGKGASTVKYPNQPWQAGKARGFGSVGLPTQAGMRYDRGKKAALVAQDGLTGTAGVNRLAMYQGTKPQ